MKIRSYGPKDDPRNKKVIPFGDEACSPVINWCYGISVKAEKNKKKKK